MWLQDDELATAIQDILPATIKQLKNSKACLGCKAGYNILIKIDTVFIYKRDMIYDSIYNYGILRKFPKRNTTWFRFRSFFSIVDSTGNEVARLIISNPDDKPTYIMKDFEDPLDRKECSAPVVYLNDDFKGYDEYTRYGILPTDMDLLNLTAEQLKVMARWVRKFQHDENSKSK